MKIAKTSGLKNRALKKMTVLIIVAMLVIVAVFYSVFHFRALKEQGHNQNENLINMENYLTSYLEEVDSIAKNVNYNYYLQNYLDTAIENEDTYTNLSVGKNMRAYEMSSQAFSDTLLSRQDISSIMIFGRKKIFLNESIYSYRNVVMDYSGMEWYKEALENPDDMIITGPNIHAFLDTDDQCISLSREIQSYEDGTFRGVILINLNRNKIAEICESFQENTDSLFGILNEDGEVVYQKGDSEGSLFRNEELKDLREAIRTNTKSSFRVNVNGKEYLITKRIMDNTGWCLVNMVPYSQILSDLWRTTLIMALAIVGILVITLIGLDQILTNVIKPLKKLESHMKKVNLENLNEKVVIDTDDEISHLAGKFNSMLERIENLKEQVVEEQEDKRKYELQALQAQINPHFLYNTLDSIIWMAETQDTNIVPMTEALAKLFRISLNKGNEEILLKKELEHVKNYLIIQSMRYADKFTYDIQTEGHVENCHVIKLIIQPIVENCIYHGIKKKRGSGHISIRAFQQEKNLIIKVSDDGCGMTEEIRSKILSDEIEPENISGSGIGVRNVNERIQLRFGKEYGIFYESEEGKGTTVTYVLPYCTEEGSYDTKK